MSSEVNASHPAAHATASTLLDEDRLDAWLREHLPPYRRRFALHALSGGQSNPTFVLDDGEQKFVLRKKPPGQLLPSAHAVDREYRIISALEGSDVPVARAWCFCDDASVIGTPFYVMAHVDGRQFMDPALPELQPAERRRVWDDFNRIIAALHTADHVALGLADYGKTGHYIQRQLDRWSRQYHASKTEQIDAMDRLMQWLPQNIPDDDATTIVHGDLRIDNLIFEKDGTRVLAVVDWELSTLGHPLADLSYHVMSWRLTADQFRGMGGKDLAALSIPDETEYLRWYCERTGRDAIDPAAWEFHMAFSMFRLAAIMQGIVKRALDGNAASDQALEVGRRARTIADIAWKQVQALQQKSCH